MDQPSDNSKAKRENEPGVVAEMSTLAESVKDRLSRAGRLLNQVKAEPRLDVIGQMNEPGVVTRVRGSVVDVEFASGGLPAINDAMMIELDGRALLVAEVQEHLDLHTVRAVTMENTSGLRRGAIARLGGGPIRVPVGEKVLGRLINVIGDPIDRVGPID